MKTRQMMAGLAAAVLVAGATAFTNPVKKAPAAKPTTFRVDASKSVLNWNGKKVTGEHYGTVNISDGSLTVDGNKITGGTFTLDMNSIKVVDLTDADANAKLTGHLKSGDFFAVDKHPTSTFVITKVTPKGGTNYDITGNMTIKDITHPVTFPAVVKMTGNALEATGKATLDRTKYDIKFRSKNFFENLGDKAIYDDFTVDLKLVANKGGAATASKAK